MRAMLCVLSAMMMFGCASTPDHPQMPAGAEGAAKGCDSPLGFIPEGRTATGYLHAIENNGQSCQQGVLTCDDGKWAGPYIFPSCTRTP